MENKTTEMYWDCECDTNYIHPKSETKCQVCGVKAEDQPDSIVNEVKGKGLPLAP